jgi:LPXTG-motif cell wall-anchored protein
MFLDPTTGIVLRVDRFESLDAGGRLFANMAPWHFGSFGGRLTQWLWFVVGFVPAMLLGSGFWLWLRKRRSGPVNSPATPSHDARQ